MNRKHEIAIGIPKESKVRVLNLEYKLVIFGSLEMKNAMKRSFLAENSIAFKNNSVFKRWEERTVPSFTSAHLPPLIYVPQLVFTPVLVWSNSRVANLF